MVVAPSGGPARRYAVLVVRQRWLVLAVVGLIIWVALGVLPGAAGAGAGCRAS